MRPYHSNPFGPNAPVFYPRKYQKTLGFFNILRGWRKGALGTNGLRKKWPKQ